MDMQALWNRPRKPFNFHQQQEEPKPRGALGMLNDSLDAMASEIARQKRLNQKVK